VKERKEEKEKLDRVRKEGKKAGARGQIQPELKEQK
jgi:hypothetical protein